jgi:hypothetical protein
MEGRERQLDGGVWRGGCNKKEVLLGVPERRLLRVYIATSPGYHIISYRLISLISSHPKPCHAMPC